MNNKAFTLVELLVVVLIIGVLAAVAVSQYQKSVLKARVMSGLAIGRSLMDSLDMHYLEYGDWTTVYDWNKFMIGAPSGATDINGTVLAQLPTTRKTSGNQNYIYYNMGNGIGIRYGLLPGGILHMRVCKTRGSNGDQCGSSTGNTDINIYFCSRYAQQKDSGDQKKCYQLAGKITCTYGVEANCKLLGAKKLKTGTYVFN